MKLKFAFLIVLAILFGFVSARVVYGKIRVPVSNGENIYFLQEGMSSDKNEFDDDDKKYDYIVEKIGDKYYAYVGITTNLSNANKIKKIYDNKNIDTYIRKRNIKNEEFYNNLEQYDILLSGALKDKEVLSINKVILSSYEEMVLKS